MATPALEERVARLEGLTEGTREEIKGVREEIRGLREETHYTNGRIDALHARIDRLESRLWWVLITIVGVQFTTWVTIMLAILFKG